MRALIKVCALGMAFTAWVLAGQPVQAAPKTLLAGPVTNTGSSHQGTYRVIYRTAEITGYCPLDPKAVRGMDYIGDRTIGANCKKVIPHMTIAAPKTIPFGTEIYVEGYGWRVVGDRGGAVKGNKLDLCVETREEALAIGRRQAQIFMLERVEAE